MKKILIIFLTAILALSLLTASAEESPASRALVGRNQEEMITVANVPYLPLNNGMAIPQLGIGTFNLSIDQARQSVIWALQAGYRHIDTAHAYNNERGVGQGIKDSGVPREEIWVTSKIWPTEYGEEETAAAVDRMLDRLGLDYIDLVYLHQPVGDVEGAWKGLEACVKAGKIRALGLSNFDYDEELSNRMIENAEIKPVIMQIECHPYAQRTHFQEYAKAHDMVLECWYPLGGRGAGVALREDPALVRIGEAHGKSAVQVIIRWHIQEGFSVIPGSSNQAHIEENLDVFDFELTEDEMETIRSLNKEERYFNMPYGMLEGFVLMPGALTEE